MMKNLQTITALLLCTLALAVLSANSAKADVCPQDYGQGTVCYNTYDEFCNPDSNYPCTNWNYPGLTWCCMIVECNDNNDCANQPSLCQWHTCYPNYLAAEEDLGDNYYACPPDLG